MNGQGELYLYPDDIFNGLPLDPELGSPSAREQYNREQALLRQHKHRLLTRDIGTPPPVKDVFRRARAKEDPVFFLTEYFPEIFYTAFSQFHLDFIEDCRRVVVNGGKLSLAIGRGFGKSTIIDAMAVWALVFGYRKFVVIVGNTSDDAKSHLEKVDVIFTENKRVIEDFPEICHPVVALQGVGQRAANQQCGGQILNYTWSGKIRQFPNIEGSAAARSLFTSFGILSRGLRGLSKPGKNGSIIRPDLILVDDPQDNESAAAPVQVRKRMKVLRQTIPGLHGPGVPIAILAAVTVIAPDDVADQITDPVKEPSWKSRRCAAVKKFPSTPESSLLWDEYGRLLTDDISEGLMDHPTATQFYREHRAAMDADGEIFWEGCKSSHEISGFQWAYNKIFSMGRDGFDAEYQQKPASAKADRFLLTRNMVKKQVTLPVRVVPRDGSFLTATVDINPAIGLHWMVMSWAPGFKAHIVDWGRFPEDGSAVWTVKQTGDMTEPQAIVKSIHDLHALLKTRKYVREDGMFLRISRYGFDSGKGTQAVHLAMNAIAPDAVPLKGFGAKDYREVSKYDLMRFTRAKVSNLQYGQTLVMDVDYWRYETRRGFAMAIGAPGSIGISGAGRPDLEKLIDHLTAEQIEERIVTPIATYYKWRHSEGITRWDWNDCLVYGFGIAQHCGASPLEAAGKTALQKEMPGHRAASAIVESDTLSCTDGKTTVILRRKIDPRRTVINPK